MKEVFILFQLFWAAFNAESQLSRQKQDFHLEAVWPESFFE
jgi:hypothetical protein